MQQPQTSPWSAFLPLLLIFAIFYFLLILPAQRQRKRQQQMLAALRTGDRVITNGGILGTIVGIRENVITLRVADQVRIEVLRSAIASLQPTAAGSETKS
ncbi:MAG: preprotein translocase subunit YajC [Terriglobia bacterium]